MDPQTIFVPAKPRVSRKRRRAAPSAAPAVALTLVAAAYDASTGTETVTLTFDRAVDVGAFDGTQVIVDDAAVTGLRWDGTGGATLAAPAVVEVTLVEIGAASGTAPVLDATAATGIAAADDGGTWAGASNLTLPFP